MSKKKPAAESSPDQHKSRHMVRLSAELHDLLGQAARRNKRPMSWELKVALLRHFREMGLEIPPELE